jgi:hypothetical protein
MCIYMCVYVLIVWAVLGVLVVVHALASLVPNVRASELCTTHKCSVVYSGCNRRCNYLHQ